MTLLTADWQVVLYTRFRPPSMRSDDSGERERLDHMRVLAWTIEC